MANISPHFSEAEFACSHCGKLPPQFRDGEGSLLACYEFFFEALENIRERWGKPMKINSGYRCAVHNAAVGGEPLSVHLFGLAADLGMTSVQEVTDFVILAREVAPDLRKGWRQYLSDGQTFVHLDAGFYIWPRPSVNFREGIEW